MTASIDNLNITQVHQAIADRRSISFELSSYGIIQIAGPDTIKFLQGQLTCDVVKLESSLATLGALCNPKGRIIALFDLLKLSDAECWLLLPSDTIDLTLQTLKKFGVFFQCEILDISDRFSIVGQLSPSSTSEQSQRLIEQINSAYQMRWDANRIIRLEPKEQAEHTENSDSEMLPEEAWRYLDIEQGRPRLHQTTQETFLPHNLNLPDLGGVSFDKGCYTGQEVVARMHYKGKLKSHLYRLHTNDPAQIAEPGAPIFADEQKVGEVVTSTTLGSNGILLGFCKDKIENSGKIQCNLENTSILTMTE